MLREILTLVDDAEEGLTLSEVARRLDAPAGLVHHMLQTLVQRGRLVELGPDQQVCTACGERPTCLLLTFGGVRYRRPRLPLP